MLFHGSKLESTKAEAERFVRSMAEKSGQPVKLAFLQFAEPCIDDVLREVAENGATGIRIFPLFTLTGRHMEEDLPSAVESFRNRFPQIAVVVEPHLVSDPSFADWLGERLLKSVAHL